ncbi:AAA family ATPase, partial [Crocosphaera sp. Alani8]|uniref:AAA family ATPase n=1 Tax=Crocosphaera sp. Alani8 TaxID=3038952 RepID=UPI00313B392D
MVASDIDSQDVELDNNNVFKIDQELSLLKTSAVYGANASGKSNLAKALDFMKGFVINSLKAIQITDTIEVEPFRLSTETETKPSYFEMTFIIKKRVYRYGFEVSKKEIIKEWLFCTPRVQEYKLFSRNKNKFKISKRFFPEGLMLEQKTKINSLFLSVVAQFNGKISGEIIKWFANFQVFSGSANHDIFYKHITLHFFENSALKKDIIKLVKDLDLSIQDIGITEASQKVWGDSPKVRGQR